MNVLVTGVNGFVGSHLVEALVARGDCVTCLVRQTSDLRWLEGLDVRFVTGSFMEPDSFVDVLAEQEIVFHLAAVLRGRDATAYHRVNAEGTRLFAEACRNHASGLRRFVYCSSLAAAGPSRPDRPRTEDDPPNPISSYGRSKLAGERYLAALSETGFPVTILRPPAIYGPRERDIYLYFRLVRWGIAPLFGGDERVFDAIHVTDLVRAFLLAAEAPNAVGRTYFVNDGIHHTWRAFAEEIGRALDRKPRFVRVPLGPLRLFARVSEAVAAIRRVPPTLHREKIKELHRTHWTCDASRAREEIGFYPAIDTRRGIAETAAWYQQHGWI